MGSHYCEWEKQEIMYLHKRKGLETNHISEKYFIPYSTCRRLWEEVARPDFDFECSFVNSTWSHYYHDVIIEYVNSFWKKTRSPFIVKDIKNKIEHDLKIWVDYEEIREIMKTKLNLSFKKSSSRPARVDP